MTRSQLRAMLLGVMFGATLGALVCLGLVRGLASPVYVDLAGLVLADSASHPDSRMNNRIFLVEPQVEGPVYITSKAIAINDLYGLVD
ncbi:MAG: hypothetical protein KME14_00115 [Tildeniella torsiva UHER 1998/13D]|nr:hypothetical protein [Tildeniella torsiva UHER 1998/13D]